MRAFSVSILSIIPIDISGLEYMHRYDSRLSSIDWYLGIISLIGVRHAFRLSRL